MFLCYRARGKFYKIQSLWLRFCIFTLTMDQLPFYKRARTIKQRKFALSPTHKQLVDWLVGQLNVPVIDFSFEKLTTYDGTKNQCITVLIDKITDVKLVNTARHIDAVSDKFTEYLCSGKADVSDEFKKDVFKAHTKPFPSFLVGFEALEEYELKTALEKVIAELEQSQKYKNLIWKINNNTKYDRVIFYFTDAQIKLGAETGATDEVRRDLLKMLKQHDEFNYFGEHSFASYVESKESFDRDYNGQDYIYYR